MGPRATSLTWLNLGRLRSLILEMFEVTSCDVAIFCTATNKAERSRVLRNLADGWSFWGPEYALRSRQFVHSQSLTLFQMPHAHQLTLTKPQIAAEKSLNCFTVRYIYSLASPLAQLPTPRNSQPRFGA